MLVFLLCLFNFSGELLNCNTLCFSTTRVGLAYMKGTSSACYSSLSLRSRVVLLPMPFANSWIKGHIWKLPAQVTGQQVKSKMV